MQDLLPRENLVNGCRKAKTDNKARQKIKFNLNGINLKFGDFIAVLKQ